MHKERNPAQTHSPISLPAFSAWWRDWNREADLLSHRWKQNIVREQEKQPDPRQDATSGAAIDALRPYKGGNDVLWQLHELNNVDKHRLILTVGSALRSTDLGDYF